MARTGQPTEHYRWDTFSGEDKPTFMGDVTEWENEVDTALFNVSEGVVTADEKAQDALDKATDAVETATNAKEVADEAKETADIAKETADTALVTANTALENSKNAITIATHAEEKADQAICRVGEFETIISNFEVRVASAEALAQSANDLAISNATRIGLIDNEISYINARLLKLEEGGGTQPPPAATSGYFNWYNAVNGGRVRWQTNPSAGTVQVWTEDFGNGAYDPYMCGGWQKMLSFAEIPGLLPGAQRLVGHVFGVSDYHAAAPGTGSGRIETNGDFMCYFGASGCGPAHWVLNGPTLDGFGFTST